RRAGSGAAPRRAGSGATSRRDPPLLARGLTMMGNLRSARGGRKCGALATFVLERPGPILLRVTRRNPPRNGHRASPRLPGRSERRPHHRHSFDERLAHHLPWLFPVLLGLMALVAFWDVLTFERLYLFKDIGSD